MVRLLAVLALVAVAAVGGAMLATGAGPVAVVGDITDGVDSSASDGSDASTPADGDETDRTATPRVSADGPPFAFAVDRVENCGETCRDVTSTLTNEQSDAATDVTVRTRIYAGNGTDGDVVWSGTEQVGTLEAGGSHTTTERVDLSLTDAYRIERSGGWITVETTVDTDERTVTLTERRQVA